MPSGPLSQNAGQRTIKSPQWWPKRFRSCKLDFDLNRFRFAAIFNFLET